MAPRTAARSAIRSGTRRSPATWASAPWTVSGLSGTPGALAAAAATAAPTLASAPSRFRRHMAAAPARDPQTKTASATCKAVLWIASGCRGATGEAALLPAVAAPGCRRESSRWRRNGVAWSARPTHRVAPRPRRRRAATSSPALWIANGPAGASSPSAPRPAMRGPCPGSASRRRSPTAESPAPATRRSPTSATRRAVRETASGANGPSGLRARSFVEGARSSASATLPSQGRTAGSPVSVRRSRRRTATCWTVPWPASGTIGLTGASAR
mmetsp:Transcript_75577/g.180565  ORF Transcript_75577/g.180565 Transcript_75577/m.180565 type:complete len:271 (-) Transcript_75577:79-891(-)